MGWKENILINDRLKNLEPHERRFRINAGMGWVSEKKFRPGKAMSVKVKKGDLILRNARPFHGAPEGWPDLAGWDEIEITPEMIGQKIAVFVGEEVKATGELRPEQITFRKVIEKMGGRFSVLYRRK